MPLHLNFGMIQLRTDRRLPPAGLFQFEQRSGARRSVGVAQPGQKFAPAPGRVRRNLRQFPRDPVPLDDPRLKLQAALLLFELAQPP